MQASLSRPMLIAPLAAALQLGPTFSFGGPSESADTACEPSSAAASANAGAKADVIILTRGCLRGPGILRTRPGLRSHPGISLNPTRKFVAGQVTTFPTTSTRIHATKAVKPKTVFWVAVSFRSAASYQMIELMIA